MITTMVTSNKTRKARKSITDLKRIVRKSKTRNKGQCFSEWSKKRKVKAVHLRDEATTHHSSFAAQRRGAVITMKALSDATAKAHTMSRRCVMKDGTRCVAIPETEWRSVKSRVARSSESIRMLSSIAEHMYKALVAESKTQMIDAKRTEALLLSRVHEPCSIDAGCPGRAFLLSRLL